MAKGKNNSSAEDGEDPGNDPAVFAKNYSLMCKSLGIKAHEDVTEILNGDEAPVQIAVDANLGPEGVRAIVEAMLGRKSNLGGKYNMVNTIRLWRSNVGEEGTRALADYLLERAKDNPDVGSQVVFLQLLDCNIQMEACKYLARALQAGGNRALLTLNLDYNDKMGKDGLRALTEGLCSNTTLQRLSLSYCELGEDCGRSVKNILMGMSSLEQLVLRGNRLGGKGLKTFARALGGNKMLKSLDISSNDIGKDEEPLLALAGAVSLNKTLLELKFHENGIEEVGAKILIDSGAFDKKEGNTTLKEFTLDTKIPMEMFESLLRSGGGGGKGKGKGKKGKKKK